MSLALVACFGVALSIGVLLGWLIGSRAAASANETVANLRVQVAELTTERESNRSLGNELAALKAAQQEREKSFEHQLATLHEAKESLSAHFQDVARTLLGDARKTFLEQAGERFSAAVSPVELLLKHYQERLQTIERERVDSYGELRGMVGELRKDQGQVRDETRNLVNALRSSPKARGRWGEQSLRNVLTHAGLTDGIDFHMEVSVDTSEGRLRPDVVVKLPNDRKLVIDAKCSLNAYLEACEEVDDDRRAACFRAHVASIRNHAQQLGSKSYWSQFDDAADYVVMYIPGEHFLTAALELDPGLWEWAFERRVLLATPTNLVAIARTVASVWRQEKLNEAAEEIASLGKELHSRLATMNEHMARVGKNLATANSAYNQMVGSFESQVLTQAKRFESLGAGSAKTLDSPPMVEVAPRPLTKVAANIASGEPPQIAAE